MIRWFLQHFVIAGEWVKYNFLSRSYVELITIRQLIPEMDNFRHELQSYPTVMEHLENSHRFTDVRLTQLNTLVEGWDREAGQARATPLRVDQIFKKLVLIFSKQVFPLLYMNSSSRAFCCAVSCVTVAKKLTSCTTLMRTRPDQSHGRTWNKHTE